MKPTRRHLPCLCLLSGFAALFAPMNAQAQLTNALLTAHKFQVEVTQTVELQYLLHLPQGYDGKSGKRWPLLLFLHGAGERGADVQRVAVHGPLKLARQGTNFPFLIVAPLCPAGERWQDEPLLKLLEHLAATRAVDPDRVYVTGLSMGGYGTWSLGLTQPQRFAAIAPICGGGQMIDALLGSRDRAQPLKTLGVWAFHGAKDPVVPLEETERMVRALKQAGCPDVKLTVYPEAQHDSWTETYNNPEFYAWLLQHRRSPK